MERLSARGRAAAAVSIIALSAALAAASGAQAQSKAEVAPAQPSSREEPTQVEAIVVGARASQQSSIQRKKRSATAQDSIVADDVGSFPDSNVNEAMSRVAGVAIERNGFGEGEGVSIRGNGPDLTRIELDGMGVAASGYAIAVGNSDGGRGADLREFPAEMIKSLDVIKGQTADMTPGGLGATVQIQTRTGLDFKKPYLQIRGAAAGNSLSRKASPELGLVASRKFFDNRLGVIANVSYSKRLNDSHSLNSGGSSNAQGYLRFADFDNSPEKTFTYNPAAANGVGADQPINSWALANGSGSWNAPTPIDVYTKSAAAQTKAECLSAFPLLTSSQLSSIAGGSNGANRQAAQAAQINAQISCLNQWNDYAPNLVRDQNWSQYEDRISWDLRFDYRVNDDLTIFAKYQVANRNQVENNRQRTRGGVDVITGASSGYTATSLVTNTAYAPGTPNILSALSNGGYYIYNTGQPAGVSTIDTTPGSGVSNNAFPIYGVAANIVPGSVVVDGNHHLTSFDITNAAVGIDHIQNEQIWDTNYFTYGADYDHGPLKMELRGGRSNATYSRYDIRLSRSYTYGNATMRVLDNGVWTIDTPSSYDETNMANFVQMLAPTANGQPSYSSLRRLTWNPRQVESSEDQLKFDITYKPDIPFFTRFKVGVLYRGADANSWGGGGYSPSAGVYVPTLTLRSDVRACENVATTTAANACVYGYVPNPTTGTGFLYGVETVTREQLVSIFQNSLEELEGPFMQGYDGTSGLELWDSIDVKKAFSQLASAANYNFDCLKECTGSDGKVYKQPYNQTEETHKSWYWMAEFSQQLPFGMELQGNLGSRMFKTEVAGSGYVKLNYTVKTAAYDPLNPSAAAGITTTSVTKPVTINKSYTGWLPSYNAALWPLPDKVALRYSWAKTVAPPPMNRLWPGGECTYDERKLDGTDTDGSYQDMTCGTFGNADLKPYQATKNNTSIEWYPNKDTSISLAYFRQKVRVGAPISVPVKNLKVFEGSDETVPGTDKRLSDYEFGLTTYANGPGYVQSGWEFSARTAFTFLPWRLNKTGMDFNVSTTKSSDSVAYMDPLTADGLSPTNQAKYFLNAVLWYDDGKTKARLAFQARDRTLTCISPCGNTSESPVSNAPNTNRNNYVRFPYNPSEPYYSEKYEYLDAKISRKLNRNLEVYLEARNILNAAKLRVGSDDRGFESSPNPWTVQYGGSRMSVGFTYKN
ncbi:TonB-dependent receptor [Caulobacter sp. 602-2]|uniref:TonB-dependent receptor n=1 Tax=Caulobacter sp. 602-2 TaxID=2710887 RepID=A0A6G4QZI5_9CAUL|nr:TonB-dependent receptor [Caulobacter sp. 602-2]NGM50877.1 TonB-dependent receptor [Caulobacter sp. 602-2]